MNQSADSLKSYLRVIQGYVPDLFGMLVFESHSAAQQARNESGVVRLSPLCRTLVSSQTLKSCYQRRWNALSPGLR
jgi:hypothetical protein